MGGLRQFQNLDALFHVALIGRPVRLDVPRDSALLASRLGGLAVEELGIDSTVKLVHGLAPNFETNG
jgi:hypothetical protein